MVQIIRQKKTKKEQTKGFRSNLQAGLRSSERSEDNVSFKYQRRQNIRITCHHHKWFESSQGLTSVSCQDCVIYWSIAQDDGGFLTDCGYTSDRLGWRSSPVFVCVYMKVNQNVLRQIKPPVIYRLNRADFLHENQFSSFETFIQF